MHPQLIKDCGKNENEWSGLALGIGLDRAVMVKKNISDIRVLRSSNSKITQMLNLELYKEVSSQPKVVTDLSICVNKDIDSEMLGDKIRMIMINEIELIEEIIIKSETS
jgi:phenylalanyl-tRNA synthetase alpha chain